MTERSEAAARDVLIRISPGELLDRVSILELKVERIEDAFKRDHALRELEELQSRSHALLAEQPDLAPLIAELKTANSAIWDAEEVLRRCERESDFGPAFVDAARVVYRRNDQRAALKGRIDDRLGSSRREVKSHDTCDP